MALSTDEAIATAFGFVKTEPPPQKPQPTQPQTIAERLYPHLISNQKGPRR